MNFPLRPEMSASFYEVGHYIKEITMAKLNTSGELCITLKVTDSHDNRRINSYYTINFFTSDKRSDASISLWKKKQSDLLNALGIKEITSEQHLQESLVGESLTVEYWKRDAKRGDSTGPDPLPNFMPLEVYTPEWTPKPSKPKFPAQQGVPPLSAYDDMIFDESA